MHVWEKERKIGIQTPNRLITWRVLNLHAALTSKNLMGIGGGIAQG